MNMQASETLTQAGEPFSKSYTYDPATGFKTPETIYGITNIYSPAPQGNLASMTDANGHTMRYGYDSGVASQIQTPEHTTTRRLRSRPQPVT